MTSGGVPTVCGGKIDTGHKVLDTCFSYDAKEDSWRMSPGRLTTPRMWANVVEHPDHGMVVAAGYRTWENDDRLASVESSVNGMFFDRRTVADLPDDVTTGCMTVDTAGNMYMVGGFDGRNATSRALILTNNRRGWTKIPGNLENCAARFQLT